MTSLNATVMLSQYGGRQQSKGLHYIKKNLRSEMKGGREKQSVIGVRRYIEKSVPGLVTPDSDPRNGFFYLPLIPMIEPYNPSRGSLSGITRLAS